MSEIDLLAQDFMDQTVLEAIQQDKFDEQENKMQVTFLLSQILKEFQQSKNNDNNESSIVQLSPAIGNGMKDLNNDIGSNQGYSSNQNSNKEQHPPIGLTTQNDVE